MGSRRESAVNLNHNSLSNARNSTKSINFKNVPSRIDTNLNNKNLKERKSTHSNLIDIISKDFMGQNRYQAKTVKKCGSQQQLQKVDINSQMDDA